MTFCTQCFNYILSSILYYCVHFFLNEWISVYIFHNEFQNEIQSNIWISVVYIFHKLCQVLKLCISNVIRQMLIYRIKHYFIVSKILSDVSISIFFSVIVLIFPKISQVMMQLRLTNMTWFDQLQTMNYNFGASF